MEAAGGQVRGGGCRGDRCRLAWTQQRKTDTFEDSCSAAVRRALWLVVFDRGCPASVHWSVGLHGLADVLARSTAKELGCRSRRDSRPNRSRAGRGENFDHYVVFADGTHLIRLPSNMKIIAGPNQDQLASGVVAVWAGVVEINQRSRVIRRANRPPGRCTSPLCHRASNQPRCEGGIIAGRPRREDIAVALDESGERGVARFLARR